MTLHLQPAKSKKSKKTVRSHDPTILNRHSSLVLNSTRREHITRTSAQVSSDRQNLDIKDEIS